jgi:predicted anti-sigma-YlaC factor YlaD
MRAYPRLGIHIATALLLAVLPGCSVRKLAVNSLGNAVAEGGATFSSENDPELARDAAPFSLKTMEALLEETPRHRGLLLAAAAGFTRYAFAFVQQDADYLEPRDLAGATAMRQRAVRLYLRARDYGLRGLAVDFPDFLEHLRAARGAALAPLRKRHVPLLYWTGASWAGAMSLDKSDSSLTADQDLAEALMKRALELDEPFELGSIHDFFISYEAGRSSVGGSLARARQHFARAVALSNGQRAWPYLSLAESASVSAQDRAEFERLLNEALAIDPDRLKTERLSNILAQRRARWLLSRVDELFVE